VDFGRDEARLGLWLARRGMGPVGYTIGISPPAAQTIATRGEATNQTVSS